MVWSYSFKAYACHILPIIGNTVKSRGTAGCGTPHTVDGTSRNFSVSTNGSKREYRLHLPKNYDPDIPVPLVISYHGHGRDMVEQETLSQFSNDAISPNMIAVYPQGLKGAVSRTLLFFLPTSSYLPGIDLSLISFQGRIAILGRRIASSAWC